MGGKASYVSTKEFSPSFTNVPKSLNRTHVLRTYVRVHAKERNGNDEMEMDSAIGETAESRGGGA